MQSVITRHIIWAMPTALLLAALANGCGGSSAGQNGLSNGVSTSLNGGIDIGDSSRGADVVISPGGPCTPLQGQFENMGLYEGSTDQRVGNVTLAISGNNLIVKITTNSPYTFGESHLYLGTATPNKLS